MFDVAGVFLAKAEECLAGAESEFANGRYNNCANRCYYACFQAAITALIRAGIQPGGPQWSHTFVPAQFNGQLVNRRKLYSSALRDVLERTYALLQAADYTRDQVTEVQASRALRRVREFLAAIRQREDEVT